MRDLSDIKADNLSRSLIEELALRVPEIAVAYKHWQAGEISWEQATYLMIVLLLKSRDDMMNLALMRQEQLPPPVIPVGASINPDWVKYGPVQGLNDRIIAEVREHKQKHGDKPSLVILGRGTYTAFCMVPNSVRAVWHTEIEGVPIVVDSVHHYRMTIVFQDPKEGMIDA